MKITFYETFHVREFTAKLNKEDFITVLVEENFTALLPNWKFFPIHIYLARKLYPLHGDTSTFLRAMYDYESDAVSPNDIQLCDVEMSFTHDCRKLHDCYDVSDCVVQLNSGEEEFIKELIWEKLF